MANYDRIVCIIILLALSLFFVSDNDTDAKEVFHVTTSSACERVFEYFTNCLGFLVENSNANYGYDRHLQRCCQHVEKLNILAKHSIGPRFICRCIQVMVKGAAPALDPSRIQDLPLMCNTTLSFPISDSMDCFK